jgi:mRNA-degrading endonuclease RelE of RelBE toxin-antitoxin system
MNYDVDTIEYFEHQAKRLKKKYPSLINDLALLIEDLKDNPFQGTSIGGSFYKVRMAIASKGRGKSGGARVMTYVKVTGTTVYLTSIFDKTEQDTISVNELKLILKQIP